MSWRVWCFFLSALVIPVGHGQSKKQRYAVLEQSKSILEQKDYLGFRAYLRKAYGRIKHPREWMGLRALAMRNVEYVGFDLIYAIDRRPPGRYVDSGPSNINKSRFDADNLLASGSYQQAFDLYQKIAVELRRLKRSSTDQDEIYNIDFIYPFILHGMGRSLFGAGRFDESYVVLRWIPQNYPKFRQVQFEKMWSAFRGGRIDHALGAIASQSSPYFSRFMAPESYLVQTYLYKKLCREDDYQQVLSELKSFKSAIDGSGYNLSDWASSEIETRVLLNLLQVDPTEGHDMVPVGLRKAEQERIKNVLARVHGQQRTQIKTDLDRALAYVQLTVKSGPTSLLKPIEKLPDRASLFQLDLEIWPADSAEEWIDEAGTHRFVGNSLCGV